MNNQPGNSLKWIETLQSILTGNLARENELHQVIEDLRKLKPVPQLIIYILIDTLANLVLANRKLEEMINDEK